MNDLGIVCIRHLGPVAILKESNEIFVGAFCSGKNNEDLTVSIFSQKEVDERSYWHTQKPAVLRLKEKLSLLNPKIHTKIKSVLKKFSNCEK